MNDSQNLNKLNKNIISQSYQIPIKMKEYEISLFIYNQYNEDMINTVIDDIIKSLDQNQCRLLSKSVIIRYDMVNNKRQIKVNMITIYLELASNLVEKLNDIIKLQDKFIIKHILIKKGNLISKNLDYKSLILMKKHMFESQRIMPRQLNNLNKKQQRILAQNIKRCRVLGLLGFNLNKTK